MIVKGCGVATLLLVLAACSGGSSTPRAASGSSSTTPAPSAAAPMSKAFQACQGVARDLSAASSGLQALVQSTGTPADAASMLQTSQKALTADAASAPAALRQPITDLADGIGRLREAVAAGSSLPALEARAATDFSAPLKALTTACQAGTG